jgi:glycosyltransferase involved in cell wall biosynthesis
MITGERAADARPARPTLVFVVPRLARGGTLSVIQGAWEHLRDHRIVVITLEHSTATVPHETVLLPRRLGDPLRFPGAWIYAWRVALATGAGSVLAGRWTRTPVVVMDHGSAIVIRTRFFWRERMSRSRLDERIREPFLRASLAILHRIALWGADRVLLPSHEAIERFAGDGVARGRIARYHVPLDLARFHPPDAKCRRATRTRLGVADDRVLVLSVGRLTPEKGLDVLVDAVARLRTEGRPIVAIAGAGPMRTAIERRAAERGIDIRMIGEVTPDDLPDVIGAADVVAYASRQGTNVPVAILEAMACGRLVVATDQPPASHELLADGRGIVVPAGDVDRYAEALQAAVAMTNEGRRAAGEAARRWIEAEHGPDRVAAELADAFSPRLARGS